MVKYLHGDSKAAQHGRFLEDGPEPTAVLNEAVNDLKGERPEETLTELEARIQQERMKFVDGIASSTIFTPGTTLNDDENELLRHQSNFTRAVALSILEPIRNGMSLGSVIKAATLARVMWVYSPVFRDSVKDLAGGVYDKLNGEIRRRISVMENRGNHTLAQLTRTQWDKLRDMTGKDGERVPFTAETAALAEVGLMMRGYQAVREEGADIDNVAERYGVALQEVYAKAGEDGIRAADIAYNSRAIISRLIRDDPSYATMFYETAYQDYKPCDPDIVETDGRRIDRNAGKFVSFKGDVVGEGVFHVRPPADAETHSEMMAASIARHLSGVKSAEELSAGIGTYLLAYSAVSKPEVRKHPDLNAEMRTAFAHVAAMVKGAHDDGIRDVEAELVYSDALTMAIDVMQDVNPTLAAEWGVKYGDAWFKHMQGDMKDPERLAHIWEGIEQKLRAESMSEAGNRGTYTSADYRTTEPGREHESQREYPSPGHVDVDPPTVKENRPDPGRPYRGKGAYERPAAATKKFLLAAHNQEVNREKGSDGILGIGSEGTDFNDPSGKLTGDIGPDNALDDFEPEL